MNIPYTYLAVLLVFTLLVGVVIGDRLAAGAAVGQGVEGASAGRSGSCAGLASARLHNCVHRNGRLPELRTGRRSGDHLEPWQHTDPGCGPLQAVE